jgi:hypothetical protein
VQLLPTHHMSGAGVTLKPFQIVLLLEETLTYALGGTKEIVFLSVARAPQEPKSPIYCKKVCLLERHMAEPLSLWPQRHRCRCLQARPSAYDGEDP